MTSLLLLLSFLLFVNASSIPPLRRATAGISQSLFDEHKFYYQYASSAYSDSCPRPNGNVLIETITNTITDTQGFIARDDNKQEIILALRGR
ncbi:hypothetical protein HGRIS_000463 [Hohenbuehelia grisea]|uniref:Uncharacterized protein n=1 Tax=Hohenbuehelia grisea TaxID=104357 RepID=A0ABR3JT25_9AGAR